MDADVAGAVGRELRALLADRLAGCHELDAVFAHDIAERVAGFTRRGGRRIRPRLMWWSLRACGGGNPAQVRATLGAAAALELVQTCALVQDDLMDRAPSRRGTPSLHTDVADQYAAATSQAAAHALGTSAAVLAGDLALVWADDALAGLLLDAGLPHDSARRLNGAWRALRTELAAGQYLDVQGQATSVRTVTHSIRAACLKSARYTVERPLELGAVLAGADPATTGTLCRAGRRAGLAFQLRDDLDDLFADPEVTGKPSGGDVREGKPTYPLAVARALATAAGDRYVLGLLERTVGRAGLTESELVEVREVITATGARELVEAKITRLTRQCLRELSTAALEPGAAARLCALLTEITGASGPLPEPSRPPAAVPAAARTEAGR
ncbi:polyprenyl synthetase family protein [Streptomyces actinomycinicus]|uniref:polyprenyl synthetase family protein n=1 Tax=Streptomyces actinomycinicus TaxID=1695166 RepID=UPI0027DA3630|nr:polyprenyl synthetase family protein [Streptomyces actinomycinicus]